MLTRALDGESPDYEVVDVIDDRNTPKSQRKGYHIIRFGSVDGTEGLKKGKASIVCRRWTRCRYIVKNQKKMM